MSSDHVTSYENLPLFGPVHTEAIDQLLFLKGFSLESFLIPKAKRFSSFQFGSKTRTATHYCGVGPRLNFQSF